MKIYRKEYFYEEPKDNTTEKGIKLEHTAPTTPLQNSRSERANRTTKVLKRNEINWTKK